jgi:hypothetical protein
MVILSDEDAARIKGALTYLSDIEQYGLEDEEESSLEQQGDTARQMIERLDSAETQADESKITRGLSLLTDLINTGHLADTRNSDVSPSAILMSAQESRRLINEGLGRAAPTAKKLKSEIT